jgi:hypothetical protein
MGTDTSLSTRFEMIWYDTLRYDSTRTRHVVSTGGGLAWDVNHLDTLFHHTNQSAIFYDLPTYDFPNHTATHHTHVITPLTTQRYNPPPQCSSTLNAHAGRTVGIHDGERDHVDVPDHWGVVERYSGEYGRGLSQLPPV